MAASGMAMIARAARGCPKPTPPIGTPRSHATGRADAKTLAAYSALGWRAFVAYECELKDRTLLGARLAGALKDRPLP